MSSFFLIFIWFVKFVQKLKFKLQLFCFYAFFFVQIVQQKSNKKILLNIKYKETAGVTTLSSESLSELFPVLQFI